MLKGLLNAAVIALFACLVFAFAFAVESPSNEPENAAAPQAEKSAGSYLQKYSAYCAAKPTKENDKWRHDFWCEFKVTDFIIAIFTVVLAVVTAGLILVGICQTGLLRREFVASHRPRIRIRRIVPAGDFVTRDGQLVHDQRITFTMEVVNIGDGAALAFEFGFDVFFRGDPFNAARAPRPDFPPLPAGFENILTLVSHRRALTDAEVDSIELGTAEWRVLGIMNYWDENRILRATSFARKYDPTLRRFVKIPKNDPDADREFEN